MAQFHSQNAMLRTKQVVKHHIRSISKYLDRDIAGKAIRKRFLDYFIDVHNHNFVKSSPVVPFCDPTVAFVNAGMNQFKNIFLGTQTPNHKRVVNSQKCVRVGGKHNDLDIVGKDGYHHTFFEMLGNWSFGDYFKKEACAMSWTLLTDIYKINKLRLYVTYFGGDEKLGLKPDLECLDIWKSIGVPADRILPFGTKDNFWEMGMTGPCGPCTEIHVDHLGQTNRSEFVNKGLHDLTEIWNIVFIQFNRNADGSIKSLPDKHVDTGMGFERLTAVLQGQISNYDTDIFSHLFTGIQKICKDAPAYGGKFGEADWNGMDTSYRILADHARMVTACLADGMIPEQNQKLRRVIRRAFLTSETALKKDRGLLKELSNYVVENLGPVYPEMEKNIKQVHQIIDFEEEVYKSLRSTATAEWKKITRDDKNLQTLDFLEMPGLISAVKDLKQSKVAKITPDVGFKLYDTFGLDEDTISQLATCLKVDFDLAGFQVEMQNARMRSKKQALLANSDLIRDSIGGQSKTDDSFKYNYKKENDKYVFENLEAGVLKIFQNDKVVDEIEPFNLCSLILDRTNFYSDAGGQISDGGLIEFSDGVFEVSSVANVDGCVLHTGVFNCKISSNAKISSNKISSNEISSNKISSNAKISTDSKIPTKDSLTNVTNINSPKKTLAIGSRGLLKFDEERRLKNMQNHTAVHLLNAVLKKTKGSTCQKSSKVTDNFLNLDVGIFGDKLTEDDVRKVEEEVNRLILSNIDVTVKEIDSQKLFSIDNLTLIPGEIYPDTRIRLVEVVDKDLFSREPCCGTHVLNTGDIKDFCVVGCKSLGRSTMSIHAVTGERAELARKNGQEILEDIEKLKKDLDDYIDTPEVLDVAIMAQRKRLTFSLESSDIVPYLDKQMALRDLADIKKELKDKTKNKLKELIEMEMQEALQSKIDKSKNNQKFLVHYLISSMMLESVTLQRATKLCPDIPVLVISFSENMVKARCCVPKALKSNYFNAQKWIGEILKVFKSTPAEPRGEDLELACNMKPKKINLQDWDTLLSESLDAAKKFAEENL